MKNLVVYSASWCNPCKQLKKIIELSELSIPVTSIDIDEDATSASEYAIRGVPTLLLMEDNQVLKRSTGAMSVEQLQEFCA
jgi:thioredoxin 1|tara:strand:+ start:318 stop:560 length:243 start_codon:yes stop_codon:yes gene_type:complete